jgi:outer membrane protein assembly factor BamB
MNHRMFLLRLCCSACFGISAFHTVAAGDWRQFRGNLTNSVAAGESLPTQLSGDTIAWKTPLPGRGVSGPIVVRDRVFVSASSGYTQDRLHVLAIDAVTGKVQWERQFTALGRTQTHEKMSNATPTMASDGERVFAFFSSNDLICLDLEGRLQWFRGFGSEFPNASNSLGMSSSPIVVGSTVIVQVESDAESFACGVDAMSGETRWKLDRPRAANWTSPCLIPATDTTPALALLQSSKGLTAVDPETGRIVWDFDKGASTIPSSTVDGTNIVIPSNGLTAIRTADGTFEQLWNSGALSPSTSSPVVVDGMTLTLNSAGVLTAGDATTGERKWQLRLRGSFSSTPLAAGGYLYLFNEDGFVFVVRPEAGEGKIVSELDLSETILCSPAASDNALYIRSDGHLFKFAARP